MDQMEDKLGAILGNPDMMQKIMSMAQSLGAAPEPPKPSPPPEQTGTLEPTMPELDMGTVQKLMRFARQTGIDPNQQALLKALGPFLSRERVGKLEKAMRAAKLANLATSALGQFQSGR